MVRKGDMKAVFWGTGKEHTAQLFDLSSDPDEMTNLASTLPGVVAKLEKVLLAHIPYDDDDVTTLHPLPSQSLLALGC